MAFFRKNLPAREDAILVFGWCVFLIHVWAILNILEVLPAWALRLGAYELMGVTAYPLVFALIESIIVWVMLVIASIILPRSILGVKFISQSSTLIFIMAVFSAFMHFNDELILQYRTITLMLLAVGLLLVIGISYQVGKSEKYLNFTRALLTRVTVLSWLYVFFDLIGVLVIFIRNY